VAGSLADPAIGDRRLGWLDAFGAVKPLQFLEGLECSVVLARLAPANAARTRDVSAALAGFRQTRRRLEFARELLWTPHIDQYRTAAFLDFLNLRQKCPQ